VVKRSKRVSLATQKCIPCEGGAPKLSEHQVEELLKEVKVWNTEEEKLHKRFIFEDFVSAMRFVERMAELAEAEGHHPDFCVHYNTVDVTIWTHAINGLSENDFILAAKIDALA